MASKGLDAQRELLDQLMGKNRNLSKDDAPLREQHWNDPDVCPYYLCAFCPNDLFINTKSDLGQCEYEHVYELKTEYEKQTRKVKRRVEKKLLYYLYDLIKDVDRKIRRGKDRISLNAPSTDKNHSITNVHNQLMNNHYNLSSKVDIDGTNDENNLNDINIDDKELLNKQIEQKKKDIELRCEQLDYEINKLNDHIDILCNDEKIDDAEVLLKQVETLEKEKSHLKSMDLEKINSMNHEILNNLNGSKTKDKNRFEICEICGVFQAIDDAEDRIARHFDGKQHKGYDIIRKKIKQLELLHKKEEQQERDEKLKNKNNNNINRLSNNVPIKSKEKELSKRSKDKYYIKKTSRKRSRSISSRKRYDNKDSKKYRSDKDKYNKKRSRSRDRYNRKDNKDKYKDKDKKHRDKKKKKSKHKDKKDKKKSSKHKHNKSISTSKSKSKSIEKNNNGNKQDDNNKDVEMKTVDNISKNKSKSKSKEKENNLS